ncbi:MAG: transporter substrate-binding domain-containing protein [Verrucomicrobia bacterium]|nr:transporter substrate-binding domain-containing protein [Verrucomicrobiota bacterium]MCG2681832.1 transporter substrate-binding domain-containing protein [Kiritimatiellia bacterium]MBU4247714.1 transporter substrate-binding domain-containing protein [Verrucomicrobiota bacterium]MBU4291635.1 transporter substrate-binding domain-containing protein [Verrucomicrobiota bacterium]MBU4429548.1 transporter substrate-binding domain-containing protein [Verrucomicrobiota bacterium]
MNVKSILSKNLIVGAVGIMLAAGIGGCVSGGGNQAGRSETNAPILRVGVTPNMPPIVYKQGDDVIGLEADLARALGRELGRPVRFVQLKWDDQIPALIGNKTDIIMSGMSVTRMRAMRIAFTDPYLEVGQLALVRRCDLDRFFTRGAVMLTTGIVGVEKGTTGDLFVQQEFPHAKRVSYASSREAVKALIAARIDLFVHDAPVVWWLAAEHESEGIAAVNVPLTTENLAWGVREEDPALLKAVNGILARWKQDEKLQGMVKRWIPYARTL